MLLCQNMLYKNQLNPIGNRVAQSNNNNVIDAVYRLLS